MSESLVKNFKPPRGDREMLRSDGSKKSPIGFLGPLKHSSGKTSTEISITVGIDGKDVEVPSLVPTLSKSEVEHMLSGKKATKAIRDKAARHAIKRRRQGKSPFFSLVEDGD